VQLRPGHEPTERYVRRLRRELPRRLSRASFWFQPADIVRQVINFGVPSRSDVQVEGATCRVAACTRGASCG